MLEGVTRRQLILYATPAGPLADACERYYSAASAIGPTAAQTYPPHCTLTGFFHRSPHQADQVIAEMKALISDAGRVPDGAVGVEGPTVIEGWVGLELASPWLADLTARIVACHRLRPGDDALRPKNWLHLSLAYGIASPARVEPFAELAQELVTPAAPAVWEVAVWERTGRERGDWVQH